jgi:hypothetical protein
LDVVEIPLAGAQERRSNLVKLKHREEIMKIPLLLALVALAVPAIAQQQEDQKQALARCTKAFDDAFNANDAAAIAALFTKDATYVTDGSFGGVGIIVGRDAIQKYYTDLLKTVQFSNHKGVADAASPHMISPTSYWSSGSWTISWKTVDGSASGDAKGFWSSMDTMEDGVYKDALQTWNQTPPPPPANK